MSPSSPTTPASPAAEAPWSLDDAPVATDPGLPALRGPDELGEIDPRWAALSLRWLDTADGPVRALAGGAWTRPRDVVPHLLVHGLGTSALSWVDAAAELAGRGVPVVAPDQPGFGRSRPRDGAKGGLGPLVDSVVHALDALGWDRVVLHGNSLGALLVLRAVPRIGDRLAGLVLSAPAVPLSPWRMLPPPLGVLSTFVPLVLPGVGEAVVRLAAAREGRPYDDAMFDRVAVDRERALSPEMLALYEPEMAAFRSEPWRWAAQLAATRAAVPAIASGLFAWRSLVDDPGCPVAVAWGAQDGLLPASMLAEIRARRPGWRVEVFEDSAHIPQGDEPQRYVDLALEVAGTAG